MDFRAVLSLALLQGCAASIPAWYAPSPRANADEVIGRGACGPEIASAERAQCAVRRATDDALLQLRAEVRTSQEQTCRLVSSRSSDGAHAEASCLSTIASRSEASLQVTNAVPREQACVGEECYALVALSRSELAANSERVHAAQRAEFEALLATHDDLLGTLSALSRADALAGMLDEDALTIAVFRAVPQAGYAERVTAARHALLANASVCLQASSSEPSPERVFAATSAMLSERGVDRVQLARECPRGALVIDFHATDAPAAQPSDVSQALWTMRYAGRVRVSAPDAAIAREREVQGRGLSKSADSARRDAEDRLADAVREAVASLVLGLTV